MNKLLEEFKPFNSSFELNIFLYILLSLLTIHISNSYFLESVKKVPMKSERFNLFVSAIFQSFFISTPSFILLPFLSTPYVQYIPRLNGFFVLIASGFSVSALALYLNNRLSIETSVLNNMIGLFAMAACSSILQLFDFKYKLFVHLLFAIATIIVLVFQFKSSFISINEPNASRITSLYPKNFMTILLFPFELILENVLIVSTPKVKKYSGNIHFKMIASPLFFEFLAFKYFEIPLTILTCFVSLLIASLVSSLLWLNYLKNQKFIDCYGFLTTCLVLGFIFGSIFEISKNLAIILKVPMKIASLMMVGPIASIPSIFVQSHFIKTGFQQRTLFSIFYFLSTNLIVSNIVHTLFVENKEFCNDLKSTYGGIIALMGLMIFDIIKNHKKFTEKCSYFGVFCIVQECVIMLLIQ